MIRKRNTDGRPRRGVVVAPIAALLSVSALTVTVVTLHAVQDPAQSFRSSPFLRVDPEKVVVANSQGFQPCGECHTPEWNVWKETKHATGFDEMHKSESAQSILTNMEMSVTKRQEAVCMRCHYTVGPNLRAVAGVSCESCHGPARDWVNVHNKWGDGAADAARETPAGREQRIATSRAAGMLRPSTDIYGVAANCFECHTVPMEELVNKGGHVAGTPGFELVKRVNSIRHNFKNAASDTANRPITAERARVMFVVGRLLAYEYALRGLAAATTAGRFSKSMVTRVTTASRQLSELTSVVTLPSVTQALRAGGSAKLIPNNRAELEKAANDIRRIGEQFVASNTGSALAALDPAIAGQPLRAVAEATDAPAQPAATAPAAGSRTAQSTPTAPASGPTPATPTPATRSAAPAVPAVAASTPAARPTLPGAPAPRPAWFSSDYRSGMNGAETCSSGTCHGDAADKLSDGPHQKAALRLTGENKKAQQIAELYGIGAAGRSDPGRICMKCHATVDEGAKNAIDEGVSCEACHGASEDWLKSHRQGGNPQSGMRALKDAKARALLCADCHRITDARLLSAGHPDGTRKDIVAALGKLTHWPSKKVKRQGAYPELPEGTFKAAYDAIARGRPIPAYTVVASPSSRQTAAATPAPTPAAPSPAASRTEEATQPAQPSQPPATAVATPLANAVAALVAPSRGSAPSAPRSRQTSVPPRVPTVTLPARASGGNVTLDLAAPPPTDRLTTEELLLLVKERIARVHASIRRANQ